MTTVLLIIHLMVAVALVTVILMQRSEGGALGIGGGPGGMMSGRGAATLLTRATQILGAAFFAMSILLAIAAGVDSEGRSVFDRVDIGGEPILAPDDDDLFGDFGDEPLVPEDEAPPAAPASEPLSPAEPDRA